MNKRIIPLLILILATAATAQVPTYHLETILDAIGCASVDMSPDGSKICARYGSGYYKFFNAETYEEIGNCQLNGCPWTGLFSSDSSYVWTTIYYGGYVKKVDISDCSIVKTIPLGSWTYGLAFDSQRRYLYVGENDPGTGSIGTLKVVDTSTETVVGSVTLNGEPGKVIVVDPCDNFVYLVTRNAGTEMLYKISTSNYLIDANSSLSGIGKVGISVSPDGSTVYVPDTDDDLVNIIDTAALSILETWSIESPVGFFISPDGTHALVIGRLSPDIRIFDLLTETIVQTIDVPTVGTDLYAPRTKPYWDTNRGKVYVNLYASEGGVAVLSTEPAVIAVAIDIKPGSCPNPLNVKSRGVLPVAILGSEDFDVNTIDVASVRLASVAPVRSSFEDVATPVSDGNECDCTTEGPDGYLDLTLKFKTQEIVEAIGDVNDGDILVLTLTGALYDETPIEGQDCIVLVGKARRGPKGDLNADGVVDLSDFAMLANRWLEGTAP